MRVSWQARLVPLRDTRRPIDICVLIVMHCSLLLCKPPVSYNAVKCNRGLCWIRRWFTLVARFVFVGRQPGYPP